MNITNARYTDASETSIAATIDGAELTVPVAPGNRHYDAILSSGVTVAPYAPPAPTKADVAAERDRRLAAGFQYDFGDARGVHTIGTTNDDMNAWDREVTPAATALAVKGDTTTTIAIKTETGATEVTGAEWQDILLAALAWRQPVWQSYFSIKDMAPIPDDYNADARWP